MKTNPTILYAEDDVDDQFFMTETVEKSGLPVDMVYVSDGMQLEQYLNTHDELPQLIVLDLNMPYRDGRQTLNYLKSSPRYARIPVMVLSTSDSQSDKDFCRKMGADVYQSKPFAMQDYGRIVSDFRRFLHC